MAPSSNLFFVSMDEMLDGIEQKLNYHKHNVERWKDGLRHSGRVEGIQGRQSQKDMQAQVSFHQGAIEGYEMSKKYIEALVPVEDFDEFFGAGHAKLTTPWGPNTSTYLRLDGKSTISTEPEGYVETGLDHAIKHHLPLND